MLSRANENIGNNSRDDESGNEDHKKLDEGAVKEVPLFDLDVYGRKISRSGSFNKQLLHRVVNKGKVAARAERLEKDDSYNEYSEGAWTEDEDQKDGVDLGDALFNEWDMMELERAHRAAQEGYGYFWSAAGYLESSFQLKKEGPDPRLLRRVFESSFHLISLQNIENQPQYFFYGITFGHINKNRKGFGELRRRTWFTPGLSLKSGDYKALSAPLSIWPHKELPISYGELAAYVIQIDLWSIHKFTFNKLYATTSITLQDAIDQDPEISFVLQKRLPSKTTTERFTEVQRIRASLQLTEVFDFDLLFDSWSFNPLKQWSTAGFLTALKFTIPRGARRGLSTHWTEEVDNNHWPSPLNCTYTGTLQHLQNAYFTVKVYFKIHDRLFNRSQLIGTCIFSLRSVVTYPLCRGMVKKLTIHPQNFNQGDLLGNVRCFYRSAGLPYYENQETVSRPEQPLAGAALVTQLDFKEQFLVIRLFRCKNLPVAHIDSGTSDPMIKVKWDGMTNTTGVKAGTLRPVWNQNLYFPIRLLDPDERTDPHLIENCLPLDLESKGPIVFECWDHDETSSDFLGGVEIHLSELTQKGQRLTRCLAEGLTEGAFDTSRLPDGRPTKFRYERDDDLGAEIQQTEEFTNEQPFEIQHSTQVYAGNGIDLLEPSELTGSTVAYAAAAKPLIYFEMFCIPPLPEECQIQPPRPIKEDQDLWKQWTKRWNLDFGKWMRVYLEWFPDSLKKRRFLCTAEHPQTRNLYPLPAFLTAIAVPEQISGIGELLHWISNMSFNISTNQIRSDPEISRWLSPNFFLMARKGGINDHSILLCSCLLGLGYDAYVCKGTIDKGKQEHCWVMTRHQEGWIIFWEITNKKRFYLPNRWGSSTTSNIYLPDGFSEINLTAGEPNPYYSDEYLQACYQQAASILKIGRKHNEPQPIFDVFEGDVAVDIRIEEEDIVLEGWDKPQSQNREVEREEDNSDSSKMRKWLDAQVDMIPIAPRREMVDPSSTLSFVPYYSVETVFNDKQLFGNIQNHHPTTISYDLEDPYLWRQFLTEAPRPIDSLIFIAPSARDRACEVLCSEIQADIAENIRVVRGRKGLETQMEHSEDKTQRIENYLDILEFRMRLDPEHNPGPPFQHEGWSSWGPCEPVDGSETYDTSWYENLTKERIDITPRILQPTEQVEHPPSIEQLEGKNIFANVDQQFSQAALPNSSYTPQQLQVVNRSPDTEDAPNFEKEFQTVPVTAATTMKPNLCPEFECKKTGKAGNEDENEIGEQFHRQNSDELGSFAIDIESESGGELKVRHPSNRPLQRFFSVPDSQAEGKMSIRYLRPASFNVEDAPSSFEDFESEDFETLQSSEEAGENNSTESLSESDDYAEVLDFCRKQNIRLTADFAEENLAKTAVSSEGLEHHRSATPLTKIPIQSNSAPFTDKTLKDMAINPTESMEAGPKELELAEFHMNENQNAFKDKEAAKLLFRESVSKSSLQNTAQSPPDSSKKLTGNATDISKELEQTYDEAKVAFQICPDHRMMMDDYEDFQKEYNKKNPQTQSEKSKLPTPKSVADASRPKNISDDYYTMMQRPDDNVEINQGFDIRELGFEVNEPKLDAIQKPHPEAQTQDEIPASPPRNDAEENVDSHLTVPEMSRATPDIEGASQLSDKPLVEGNKTEEIAPPVPFKMPFPIDRYSADQVSKWNHYYKMEELYYQWQQQFPVRPSHTFCGFPIHLCTTDISEIRTYLLASKRFARVIKIPVDGIAYVIRCKLYPLMGGVVSCWLFIGCEIHWAGKKERQTRMRRKGIKRKREQRRVSGMNELISSVTQLL